MLQFELLNGEHYQEQIKIFSELRLLNNSEVPNVNALSEEEFATLVCYPGSECLVAWGDGAHVRGFVLLLPPGLPYDSQNYRHFCTTLRSFLYIDRVVVSADSRGHGVGKALYEEVLKRARMLFVQAVAAEVNVRPPNPVSLAFHERMGFEKAGEQDTCGGEKRVCYFIRNIN